MGYLVQCFWVARCDDLMGDGGVGGWVAVLYHGTSTLYLQLRASSHH